MSSADPHALPRHQVVVVGGGFGGLNAVQGLRDADVGVTLVDRRNFHLFQPLLYQVASGWLSPAEIAAPLRGVLRRQRNVEVLLGEVAGFDLDRGLVRLADGAALPFDSLVVAPGAVTAYPRGSAWAPLAPGVKSLEDAIGIRRRVLLAFEAAERARHGDPAGRRAWLTFVVIGGGTTGVEMAGVLAELAREILRGDFRHIDPTRARIVLVQSPDRILPDFVPSLSRSAAKDLDRLGVRVVTGARVSDVDERGVTILHKASGTTERLESRTVLWAAGVRPSPLAAELCAAAGIEPADGQVPVGPDLSVPGHPRVFVVGDAAAIRSDGGTPLPGVAPVAMQGGRYVARVIRDRVEGRTTEPFRYRDKGLLATVGRGAAVAQLGPLRFDAFVAWVVWVFVHLMYLVGFQSRAVVLFRWAWDFVLRQRGARLITGPEAERLPPVEPLAPAVAADPRASTSSAVSTTATASARPVGAPAATRSADGPPTEEPRPRLPARHSARGDATRARRERLRVGSIGRR